MSTTVEYDSFLNLTPCERFFVEKRNRTRVHIKSCEKREADVLTLLYAVFGKQVQRAYGGVMWGSDQSFVAMTDGGLMFFNARVPRTPYDLFLDICHEYIHVLLNHEDNEHVHDEKFTNYLECFISDHLPIFLRFMVRVLAD